jgi:hypothetical protein
MMVEQTLPADSREKPVFANTSPWVYCDKKPSHAQYHFCPGILSPLHHLLIISYTEKG